MSPKRAMQGFFLLFFIWVVYGQDDVECLKEIKSSVSSTSEYLQSWDFNSSSICNFIGVQCLHPSELKVYSLSLPGAGLRGSFPNGLHKCKSLTGLDLSSNFFTGPIPSEICKMLPYLVKLDLSQNNISGGIPPGLSDCAYLNELRLQRNRLQGGIPGQIGLLPRLRDFNVADNSLSGSIPYTFHAFTEASFVGNEALCGEPLSNKCAEEYRAAHRAARARTALIAGVAAGGSAVLLAACAVCLWIVYFPRTHKAKQLDVELLDNSWLRRIKTPSSIHVSMFEQPIVNIKLSDLAAATAGFSRESVIGIGRSGVFYKATLRDGSVLSVKKLRRSVLTGSERHFKSEMESLSKVRHRNLVPLLGYCIAGNERLLVYKHMPGGTLYSRLHTADMVDEFGWTKRLKVAVGAARGFAWLHHSCNPKLVHKFITSSCLLLDEDLEPRITDFGLARLVASERERGRQNRCGNIGESEGDGYYVPPEEYSSTYSRSVATATTKGDVYAFGVVLLELVTGRKPEDGNCDASGSERKRSLVDWIGELFKSGHVSDAVDQRLVAEASVMVANGNGDSSNGSSGRRREVMQVLKIACSCVLSFPKERPSMYEVYHMLRAVGEDYYPPDNFNTAGGSGFGNGGATGSNSRAHKPPLPPRRQRQRRVLEDEEMESDGTRVSESNNGGENEGSAQNSDGVQMQRLDA